MQDFWVNGVIFEGKCIIFGVKWEISEEKLCFHQVKWGILEEKIFDFWLNGGFLW